MEQSILNKDKAVLKIRKGSFIIGMACALAGLFEFALPILSYATDNISRDDPTTIFVITRNYASMMIGSVIMFCAAALFLSIHKSGKPFSRRTVIIVRAIGVLIIINTFLPSVVAICVSRMNEMVKVMLLNPVQLLPVVSGALFLLVAQIIHYGTLLQQESDETL